MKRNNVAKRFGIASLCLGVALSAFSGITSFATSNVAVADETTPQVTDLVTVSEGANAEVETRNVIWKKSTTAESNAPCLRVSSDVPYEATFNRIFNGNSEFRFAFPNERPEGVDTTLFWGDFRFRITDAADKDNFFDIVYTTTTAGTTMYVEWNGHTVGCNYSSTSTGSTASAYYRDTISAGNSSNWANVAPAFFGYDPKYTRDTREGKLVLSWSSTGILSITANGTRRDDGSDNITTLVAKFDGTYNSTETNTGFSSKTKWGFPKMSFPNGYKVSFSSSYTNENTTDQASDVSFWKITNDGTTYEFDDTTKAGIGNNYMQAYDLMEANAGKALLGWKDNTGLYPTATALKSADIGAYTPVFLGFDTMKGASVRIDPTGGKSGIRFMTLFDKADYATAAPYIQSQGTLIAYTDKLTKGRLDAVNYATEIAADPATTVAQVPNTKNEETGEFKMFNYNVATNRLDDENGQPAYSMALTGIEDYTQTYSARGYLVVVYADGTTTQTFYTDYNETDNSRSIEEVAQLLQQTADYQNYTGEQKAVVDLYAGGAPETQE